MSKLKTWTGLVENEDAHVLYEREIAPEPNNIEDPVEEEMLGRPRNIEQLRNVKKKVNCQQRLRWDELYNVHEMVLDMENS